MAGATLVLGLAKTGLAVVEVLRAEGATVFATDDSESTRRDRAGALAAAGVTLLSPDDAHARIEAGDVDLVVPSPGARPTHRLLVAAIARGVAVRSEIDLAIERIAAPVVAITGTNGKTTTTQLTAAMLTAAGQRVVTGGNIGDPLIELAGAAPDHGTDVVVAEVSSFQLEFTSERWRPRVAVLLNIADDHYDWHGGAAQYEAAKAKVFAHQRGDDCVVVDLDDARARRVAASSPVRVIGVSVEDPRPGRWTCDADGQLRTADGNAFFAVSDMVRSLPHDRSNALCSAAAAHELGADLDAIAHALRTFRVARHRVELVSTLGGVAYYDDSKATNPHATLRAVEAFDSVVLLAGGLNKDLDLTVLRVLAPRLRAVIAFGAATEEVVTAFSGACPVERAATMRDAVRLASARAVAGDAVVLSPGCASFDMYPGGYTERGEAFAREVQLLERQGDVA